MNNSPFKVSWLHSEELGGYILHRGKIANDSFTSVEDLDEPFISDDKILTAQVITMKHKDVTLADNIRNSIIEAHPDTMRLCQIRLGAPVLIFSKTVKSSSSKVALRIWPSVMLPHGKVSLSEKCLEVLQLREGDFVSVIDAEERCVVAQSAAVELDSESLDILKSAHLKKYLQQILDKRYFLLGQRIMIEYFGKYLWLLMKRVNSESPIVINKQPKTADDICQRLTKVTIQNGEGELDKSFSKEDVLKNEMTRDNSAQNTLVYQFMKETDIDIVCCGSSKRAGVKSDQDAETQNYFGTVLYKNIGGLQPQIQEMKDLVELPLRKPLLFMTSGLGPPTGMILYGPPGTGKSMLMKACVNEAGVKAFLLQGPKILSRYFGDSEQKLQNLFQKAMDEAPSVIIVDEIDAICPQREVSKSDVEKRLVSSFVTLLDGVTSFNKTSSNYVMILATTNRIDALDPSLRRAGRFDCEIELPIPSPIQRIEILGRLLNEFNHTLSTSDIEAIAEKAHGYVGADLAAVCKESGRRALKQRLSDLSEDCVPKITLDNVDFEYGLKKVPPSAMRELIVQVPKVLWSDIGGNEDVKKKLKQAVEWPLKHPEAFIRLGIEPPRGVLLHGPPGCSKTLTAKALATESGLNFISIKGPELFSKYVGDSEKAIRKLFSKARSASPSIIFFDELDALAIERSGSSSSGNVADRVLAALLTEMDGVEQRRDVIVVAATNRPDKIDKALLRPGRIDRIVYVPLPDADTRRDIFRIQFRKVPTVPNLDLEWLVKKTDMYSGAEICAVCREAALAALERDMESSQVNERDFKIALNCIPPQTTEEVARTHEEYSKTLRSTIK